MKTFMDYATNILGINLIEKLNNCPQDPKYHSEGSVLNHMKMVFKACEKYDDINLSMCALFHDLGKLDTTKVYLKKGEIRIQSIGHENYTKEYIDKLKNKANSFVDSDNLDWEAIEFVCQEHMRGHSFMKGGIKKQNKIEYFTKNKNYDLLLKFLKADDEGRIGHMKSKPYLIILVGIPGSGKTTWKNTFVSKFPEYKVICPDDIRKEMTGETSNMSKDGEVWKKAFFKLHSALGAKKDVIFDSTACSRRTRKSIEAIGSDYQAIIIYKLFDISVEEAKQRIKSDIENGIDRSHVPDHIVEKMHVGFEEALLDINQSQRNLDVHILEEIGERK